MRAVVAAKAETRTREPGDRAMKKQAKDRRKLVLGRESIRLLDDEKVLRAPRGASGEDCTAQFTNCHTITTF
jgi:hypothetical protein